MARVMKSGVLSSDRVAIFQFQVVSPQWEAKFLFLIIGETNLSG